MDATMEEMVKKGHESRPLLNELSQHADLLGNLGNLYNECYSHKGEYRKIDTPESCFEWVMHLFKRPRYFYMMFRMSPEVFMALHNLLVSSNDLKSTTNVKSIVIGNISMDCWWG
jgi:hypothetical protein